MNLVVPSIVFSSFNSAAWVPSIRPSPISFLHAIELAHLHRPQPHPRIGSLDLRASGKWRNRAPAPRAGSMHPGYEPQLRMPDAISSWTGAWRQRVAVRTIRRDVPAPE